MWKTLPFRCCRRLLAVDKMCIIFGSFIHIFTAFCLFLRYPHFIHSFCRRLSTYLSTISHILKLFGDFVEKFLQIRFFFRVGADFFVRVHYRGVVASAERRAYLRQRWSSDPDFRKRMMASQAAYAKRRYTKDANYRQRLLAYQKAYRKKRKALTAIKAAPPRIRRRIRFAFFVGGAILL